MTIINLNNVEASIVEDVQSALAAAKTADYIVSGTLDPDATGDYLENGTENGQPAYEREDEAYWLWYQSGLGYWVLSPDKGSVDEYWWKGGSAIVGEYLPQDASTGKATVAGGAVFHKVTAAYSAGEARQSEYDEDPLAVVVYEGTDEYEITDLRRGEVVKLLLVLAARADDQDERLSRLTRLVNAAKNAIAVSPPGSATAFITAAEELHRRIDFGSPEIDTRGKQPWAVAMLPLSVAYTAAADTQH